MWNLASVFLACTLYLGCAHTVAAPAAGTQTSDEAVALSRVGELLGKWHGDSELLGAAKAELDVILAANPRSAPAHLEYARYHLKNAMIRGSRYDEAGLAQAQRSIDTAVTLSPEFGAAFVLRGFLYRLLNRNDDAYAALRLARKFGADSNRVDLEWSDLLHDEGKYKESLDLCSAVIARAPTSHGAHECVIAAHTALGRTDEADAAHRAMIALDPSAAWPHGNYASFLLCVRDQPEAAMEEAKAALTLMNYGMARAVLAAALYRHWAAQVLSGRASQAATAWKAATDFSAADPARIVIDECRGKVAYQVLRALRDTSRGVVIPPMHAVLLAAEAAETTERTAAGIFGLEVVATGRQRDVIYLNSHSDYRDQRNLTVRFTAAGVADFRKRHGADPDVALKGKTITVVGTARRERIDFLTDGKPTGKFYYQTHVVVVEANQVAIYDPNAVPPEDLPAGIDV